jgi:dihydrodipicolinate synthase/N-acetylneuraminate lyase
MKMQWRGVMPALTTAFQQDLSVDIDFIVRHAKWLVDNGRTGIVPLGSLGEGATLTTSEKAEILNACVKTVGSRVPIVAGISALSTREAVMRQDRAGCGL